MSTHTINEMQYHFYHYVCTYRKNLKSMIFILNRSFSNPELSFPSEFPRTPMAGR